MNRQDIIDMAREAGIEDWWDSGNEHREVLQEHLERFAALVASAEREKYEAIITNMTKLLEAQQNREGVAVDMIAAGIAAEREACAREIEIPYYGEGGQECAAAIRARGNTKQFEPCPFIECDCDGNHPLNQPAIRTRGQA